MAQRRHLKRTGGSSGRRKPTLTWRHLLSLCLIALVGLQGVVAQGHSHVRNGAGVSVITLGDLEIAKSDDGGATPRGDDSPSCGLCQSLGAGTTPLALAIVLLLPVPEAGVEPAYVRAPVVDVGAVSYAWTARGPPRISPLHA